MISRSQHETTAFGFAELVAYCAAMMALSALAIDVMLPALGAIGADLDLRHANDSQFVVFVFLFGFGVVHLFVGPLADRFGRRAVALGAVSLFCAASAIAAFAQSFEILLAARAVEGASAAASRVAMTAMVRDRYQGRKMAEVISVATTVFMGAPILAPAIGQLILFVGSWRLIFLVLLAYGAALLLWTQLRVPETLPSEKRSRLSLFTALSSYRAFLTTRASVGYTFASAAVFGAFFSYLGTAQQIYVDQFGIGALFPLAFAGGAIPYAAATLFNSRFVGTVGMRKISHAAMLGLIAINLIHWAFAAAGLESAWTFMAFMGASMFALGLIGANTAAIVMEPMGAIAGSAAALNGFIASTGAALIGAALGRLYDGTTIPIAAGFSQLGLVAILLALWSERGRLFHERQFTEAA
jgi:DHA1 family bicyclomycin/chloramphenicol resistance-like MFS transporter